MKEAGIILFFWLIVILIGVVLYFHIEQELRANRLCNNYTLSPAEYNQICKFKK